MMLTGQKEWIAIAALILFIAFVPTPYPLRQLLGSPVGKALALAAVVYAWKFVSCPVAILLLVVALRSGAMREYLEPTTGVTPPSSESNNFKCPSEFVYNAGTKMCTKGTENKPPECNDASMMWDASAGKCITKPTSTATSVTDTAPGAMAALNEMKNATTTGATPTEHFTPYADKKDEKFAPA